MLGPAPEGPIQRVWGGTLEFAFLKSSQVMTLMLPVQGPYFENHSSRSWDYLTPKEDSEVLTTQNEPPRTTKSRTTTHTQTTVCALLMPNTEATKKQQCGRSLVTAGSSKLSTEISRGIPTNKQCGIQKRFS